MNVQDTASMPRQRRAASERFAREAGRQIKDRFGDPGPVRGKGTTDAAGRVFDVVTELDERCEALIVQRIAELAPDALILAEEGGVMDTAGSSSGAEPAAASDLWVVDPLDGTINFAHGIPHFCVSIACWTSGEPIAGAIYDPMVDEMFSFEREPGTTGTAFVNGEPFRLPTDTAASASVLYIGGSHRRIIELMPRFRSWRRMGSAALALAWVGSGRVGAYIQYGSLHPWDYGVGAPFVIAAGGRLADHDFGPWRDPLAGTTGIIAAGPAVYDELATVDHTAGSS